MSTFIRDVDKIVQELNAIGEVIDMEERIAIILTGLTPSYYTLAGVIKREVEYMLKNKSSEDKYRHLCKELIKEETTRKIRNDRRISNTISEDKNCYTHSERQNKRGGGRGNRGKGRGGRRNNYNRKCRKCGEEGHSTNSCKSDKEIRTCHKCTKKGHLAKDCTEKQMQSHIFT